MTIEDIVTRRGIKEIVHFTTNLGLTGILATKALKCKDQLRQEQYLVYILKINTPRELDPGWSGYVHLSFTKINTRFFAYSGKWHNSDVSWRILSFDPAILSHKGVYFVTTNNAYHQHLKRGPGPAALEELFAKTVIGRYNQALTRTKMMADNLTTCEQAEVLYPGAIPIEFLRKIYVRTAEDENEVAAQLFAMGSPAIELVLAPKKFLGLVANDAK